jgi:cold shock CspA family protein
LKECLDINPSDKDIHFTLAKYLIEIKPDSPDIIYHLRRSFTPGDSNYNAQFWYARSLYLAGEISDALTVFKSLGDSNASMIFKKDPQATVIENNMPKKYLGKVRNAEYAHAFIIKDGTGDGIFAYRFNGNNSIWDQLKAEKRVVFEIAFNYRGPVAINIKPE